MLAAFHMQKGLESSHDSRNHNGQLTLIADTNVPKLCCCNSYGEIQPVPRQRYALRILSTRLGRTYLATPCHSAAPSIKS
jgi:hypothetical protein